MGKKRNTTDDCYKRETSREPVVVVASLVLDNLNRLLVLLLPLLLHDDLEEISKALESKA
jgi:hypothetical protein